jgi:phosphoserine phosphatase
VQINASAPFNQSDISNAQLAFIDALPFDRTKPLLILSDVDSTFIKQEVIELIAEHAGVRDKVAAITERAMQGEIDFRESLKLRVSLLRNLSADVLESVRAQVQLSQGASNLVETLHEKGHYFALVSGGFQQVLNPLCTTLGIKFSYANVLEIQNNQLTGNLVGAIVDAQAKANYLVQLSNELDVPPTNVIAIGDGANDLLMLRESACSISFNGKPIVEKSAMIKIQGPYLDHVLSIVY